MRDTIRRLLPNSPRFISGRLHDSRLGCLNRRSAAGACAVGLFWAFMPTPTQMLPAAASAVALRVNLPLAVALVWVTNPFTLAPVFYFNYRVGAWLLARPPQPFAFEPSWAWLASRLGTAWAPLLLGSLAVASAAAFCGYAGVRIGWRARAARRWRRRRLRRP